MERTLYHGSQIILEKPEYGKGARNNDYGRGFYCTEEIELAREWACAKQTNGYVNQYKLDLEGLRVLNLNNGKYNILNWLALLAANRTYWQNGSIAEEGKRYLKEHFLLDISEYDSNSTKDSLAYAIAPLPTSSAGGLFFALRLRGAAFFLSALPPLPGATMPRNCRTGVRLA